MCCYSNEEVPAELYKSYSNFKISPMASNLQIVFFKNKKRDVLVKFMLNEREMSIPLSTDIFPFYHWTDVKVMLKQCVEIPYKQIKL